MSAPGLRVGIVGTGRLGALLAHATAEYAPEVSIRMAGRNGADLARLAREIPGLVATDARSVAAGADLLLPCVPPGAYRAVVSDLADALAPGAVLVSVTNGVRLADLAGIVPRNPIVKVIPTVAHAAGRGVSLVVAGPRAGPEAVERVRGLFARFSRPVVIDDADDRIAANVAGSGLAVVAEFCRLFVAANAERAVRLSPEDLDAMMAETLAAVAALVQSGRQSFAGIVRDTASPGGTTEAALDGLRDVAPALTRRMVDATFRRQAELQATSAKSTDEQPVSSPGAVQQTPK